MMIGIKGNNMKPILIAECAKEHLGDIEKAKELIRLAKNAGFAYVKFQAYSLDDLEEDHPNYLRYRKCWLDLDKLKELKSYADDLNIGFYCSVFSTSMIEELATFTTEIKIPSTFLKHEDFVKKCINKFTTIHISTGMHTIEEIEIYYKKYNRYAMIYKDPDTHTKLIFYHCTSEYPTEFVQTRLCRLRYKAPDSLFQSFFEGYSDHTQGTKTMLLAWLMGAFYIEKHFTNRVNGPLFAVTNKDMCRLNKVINNIDACLIDSDPSEIEKGNYDHFTKEFKDLRNFRK